jgi:hypothetical protein
MPKWLASILIVIGFLALVGLALVPRHFEITITTNVESTAAVQASGPLHATPSDGE